MAELAKILEGGGDEIVIYLNCDGGYIIVYVCQDLQNCSPKK